MNNEFHYLLEALAHGLHSAVLGLPLRSCIDNERTAGSSTEDGEAAEGRASRLWLVLRDGSR